MPKEDHAKALPAEHHENAAKSHRMAAEHHDKGEHDNGREHASKARDHSAAMPSTSIARLDMFDPFRNNCRRPA
jgi:hypothetical protein